VIRHFFNTKGMVMMSQPSQQTISRTGLSFVLALWFVLVLIGAWLGVFRGDPSRPPLTVGIGVLLPVILFLGVWFGSSRVQRFVASLDLQTVTLIQLGRVLGGVFLLEYFLGALPGVFALPAGLGDVAIGLTAPLVAWMIGSQARSRSGVLLVWNALGSLDLIMAVSLGILTSRSVLGVLGGTLTSAPVTVLPLSLIPTFLVPFYMILHLITFARFRQYRIVPLLDLKEKSV
jgi:hypothetical protein